MGYSLGLRDVRIVPDRSKWHSYYDFGRDCIVTEAKFWKAPAAERLHMMEITGRRTVPQIFIGETHVGGCDDLIALDPRGGLLPLLQA